MKDYNMVEFEVFDSACITDMPMKMEEIFEVVSEETFKETIEEYIETWNPKDIDKVNPKELKLLSFCYAGLFGEETTKECLLEYSQIVLLQFNNIDDDIFDKIYQKSKECKHSALVFKTCFGNGINILVPVNTELEHHKTAYEQVKEYYEKLLGIESDNRTKDILYACLIGSDSDCFYNRYAIRFSVKIKDIPLNKKNDFDTDFVNKIESSIRWTENNEKFIVGNETDFFKLFAVNCNNMGYDVEEVVRYSKTRFKLKNYSIEEMERKIRFVYAERKNEFGSRQKRGGGVSNNHREGNTALSFVGLEEKIEKFDKFLKSYISDEDEREIVTIYLKGLLVK